MRHFNHNSTCPQLHSAYHLDWLLSQNFKMGPLERTKACWACRSKSRDLTYLLQPVTDPGAAGRKVRCDLNTPKCKSCAKTGKECQYALLLSWPRNGDARRSIVSQKKSKALSGVLEHGSNPHFLNVGSLDIRLYLLLSSGVSNTYTDQLLASGFPRFTSSRPNSIPRPLSWRASGTGEFENILMTHCKDKSALYSYNCPLICSDEDVTSAMLTSTDDMRFRGLLFAMSFIDSTPSSVAVQQALYALIALYVYGSTARAMPFKVRAVTALSRSFPSSLNAKDGLQHIAAGLLLSLYEVRKCQLLFYERRKNTVVCNSHSMLRCSIPQSSHTNGKSMLAAPNRSRKGSTPATKFTKEMLLLC